MDSDTVLAKGMVLIQQEIDLSLRLHCHKEDPTEIIMSALQLPKYALNIHRAYQPSASCIMEV